MKMIEMLHQRKFPKLLKQLSLKMYDTAASAHLDWIAVYDKIHCNN